MEPTLVVVDLSNLDVAAAESEAGKHATDGEGKSDKPKLSLKQIEERIAKLESTTL